MSRCPKCQHELSQLDVKEGQCPACGQALKHPIQGTDPTKPGSKPNRQGEPGEKGQPGMLPQAISGMGQQGMGLSSQQEPETWDVDNNALTYEASELMAGERSSSDLAPKPLDLDPDDIVRMSVLWGGVDDEVPSGMTIKSNEVDEVNDSAATLDVQALKKAEGQTPKKPRSKDQDDESHLAETFISDEFPPAPATDSSVESDWKESGQNPTIQSDDLSIPPEKRKKTPTPTGSGGDSSYDKTFVAADLISESHDSEDLADASAKTMPLDEAGDSVEDEDGKTYAAKDAAKLSGDQQDSAEKTIISGEISDDIYTDSGSADGGRTDAIGTAEVNAVQIAEDSGLIIQERSLVDQNDPESGKADYQIVDVLGEGGMGKVYNARQTSIDRNVAVKMLKPKTSGRRKDQHVKFLAEAVVTGALGHPNIVPIYDVARDQNGALFYSMKNVTGNPWLDTIHQKSNHDNLDVLMSVADAVAFAHARGVVHRDLKPENVMLGEFGEVLVMDWGLAMPTEKFQKQRGIVRSSSMGGTPAYMAPEMATGPITKIGPHSDIYLLGAILFEIVTGRPPHKGKNAMKCLMSAAQNKIVQTEHTGELIEIAYKAMSTDPKDRYKSVQEFQSAVRTYLAHSESITLAAAAEEDLERAQGSDNYEDYAKARFGFEEALKLWSENKRARSSLGAAKLAYAHCAMDKGDYDLAASLLDPGDLSHQPLKVDIAKAREEREARQKRLETAKRAGRVLLATLFLVVSGAAFWINNERAAAVEARGVAEVEKEKAVESEKKAVEAEKVAVAAKEVEAGLRKKAEEAAEKERLAKVAEQKAKEDAIAAQKKAVEAAEKERLAKVAEQTAKENAIAAQKKAEEAAEKERLAKVAEQAAKNLAIEEEKKAKQQELIAVLNAALAEDAAESERIAKVAEEKAKNDAITAQKKAEEAAEKERLAKVAEQKAKEDAILAQKKAEEAAEAERKAKLVAIEAKIAEEREAYISKVGLAAAKIEENAFDVARELLVSTNPRFRNWEWGYLMHLCEGYVTDYKTTERLEAGALIGDGQEFVVAGQGGLVEIRQTDNPEMVVQTLPNLNNVTVFDVAVSPNGKLIALATDDTRNGFIKIWDREKKAFADTVFGLKSAAFDSKDNYLQKHKTSHMDPVVSVQFSHDGARLLTASQDQTARVWDVKSGQQLGRLFGTNSLGHTGFVWEAVFCPNFETDEDGNLVLDENNQPKPIPETKIVTASEDGTVLVWVDETGLWKEAKPLPAFRAHRGPVYSVAVSPDGQYVATGGSDHRVLVWRPDDIPQIDPKTVYEMQIFPEKFKGQTLRETPYRELLGHDGPISSVAFGKPASDNSRDLILLTGSDDNTVKIWNINKESSVEKVAPVKTFRGHGGYVRDVVFNPQATWILSVSHDRTAKRWSLDKDANTEVYLVNGTPVDGHQDNVDAVGFSFTPESKKVVTASRDNTAQIFTIEGENHLNPLHTFTEGHETQIPSGVYFDDGKKLATAAFDNTARLWDVLSGTEIAKLEGTGYAGVIAVSPSTPQGQWVLTASDNPEEGKRPWQAKLWDAKTGKLLATFGEHRREVTAVAFSNQVNDQGQLLVATADAGGRCSVWTWTPQTAQVAEVLSPKRFDDRNAHNDRIIALSFLPNDQRLLSASYDNAVSQWNVATGVAEANLDLKHPRQVSSMNLSADGKFAVTTCFDGVIRLWNLENAQVVQTFKPEGRVTTLIANVTKQFASKKVSNDTLEKAWKEINPESDYQEFLEQGGWGQGVDQLLTQIPDQLENLNEPPRALAEKLSALFSGVSASDLLLPATSSAAISPDNKYIVATNRADRIVHGWYFPGSSYDQPVAFLIDDGLDAWSAAFSPVKTRTDLVILGFSDARQWKLNANENNQVQATASITLNAQGEVASASFSPGGEYLITGARDKAARVWSVKTGRGVVKLQGVHTAPVNAAVWAPKSLGNETEQYVLTASDDETAVLWKLIPEGAETFKAEVVRVFKGHHGPVTGAAFSPDGKWIVTVSEDQTLKLWNTETGEQVASSESQGGALLCVAFCGDGQRILTGSANNQAVIWEIVTSEGQTKLEAKLLLQGHSAPIMDVAFSPYSVGEDLNNDKQISKSEQYGLRAVTASRDNSVIVWSTRVPTVLDQEGLPVANQVLTLKRHNRPVKAVKFSPDGRYILTGSEDHRAILWPTKDWMAGKQEALENTPVSEVGEAAESVGLKTK